MAASLNEVKFQGKRKINELEDITNNNYHNKKVKMSIRGLYYKGDDMQRINGHPQQQRSPSPSEVSASSPPETRPKSVSFDLSNEKQYESSPLLTPKDEEDEYDRDEEPVVDNKQGESNGSGGIKNLKDNSDYIALMSTLRLLNRNKECIEGEISQLSRLLDTHANSTNKNELVEFFTKLINNELNLPVPHQIVKCPEIEWSRYHSGLMNVNQEFKKDLVDEKPLFKTLNLFDLK